MELHEKIPNTTFSGQPITHYSYRYTPINFDGTKRIITKGQFELVDIGPDTRYYKTFKGRELKIYDQSKSSLRQIVSMTEDEDFIVKDLLPMLNTLELTNSWDIYMELEQAKQMRVKIEEQNAEIGNLKATIKILE